MDKIQTVKASLNNFQNIDKNFSRGSVKVMYVGRNRNGSYFTRQAVEDALGSLKNMPVVGEWSDDNEDYKGHGGKIVMTDDDIKMIPTTRPWGVIPESFTHEWIQEDIGGGRTKETLVIHNVILWTAHYEQALSALLKNSSQSMEIEIVDGDWNEELEIFDIKKFNFLSLCILGENVEPAFENSHFYTLDKKTFEAEFRTMLHELSFSLSAESDKEVNEVPKKKDVKDENIEDVKKADDVKDVKDVEEDDKKDDKEPEVTVPSNDESIKKTAMEDDKGEKAPANPVAPEGDTTPDVVPSVEPTVPNADTVVVPSVDTSVTGSSVEGEPTVVEPEDFEAKSKELQEKLDVLEEKFEAVQSEKEALEAFKLKVEKEAHEAEAQKLFARMQLASEDVKDLDVHAFSLDALEKECYSIIGKKIADGTHFSLKVDNEVQDVKVKLRTDNKDKTGFEYTELFERFGK